MSVNSYQAHWEQVYATKTPAQVSWTQAVPKTSLELIENLGLPTSAKIIDVGGGDSRLVDFLLAAGYEDITVLDISAKALERAQARLGDKASLVKWIVSDITAFEPTENYDIWHDRAAFHFLTTAPQIVAYQRLVKQFVNQFLIIGTFSTDGPLKCSGLEIKQYDALSLSDTFQGFEKINCFTENHTTPFDTTQNFLFCSFKKV